MIRLPHKLLNFCRDNRLLKELSFFLYLKYHYKNGIIYDYNIKSLSDKSGYSRTKIKRMVGLFLSLKWCEIKENNLHFKSRTKIVKHKFTALIKSANDEKEILKNIYYYFLVQKKAQVDYMIRLKCDLKNPKFLKDHKKAKSLSRKKNLLNGITPEFILSAQSLSKLWNCSASMGSTILRSLEKHSFLFVNRCKIVLKRCSSMITKVCDMVKGTYWSKGRLIKVLPNSVVLRIKLKQ